MPGDVACRKRARSGSVRSSMMNGASVSVTGRNANACPEMRMSCRMEFVRNRGDNGTDAVQRTQFSLRELDGKGFLDSEHDLDVLQRVPCRGVAGVGVGAVAQGTLQHGAEHAYHLEF